MGQYQFVQRCHGGLGIRARDVAEFMNLMRDAFQVHRWVSADGNMVEVTPSAIEVSLRSLASSSELMKSGVTWVVKSEESSLPIILKVTVGGNQRSMSFFTADFSRTTFFPDILYFRRSIEMIRPFEAFILDEANDREMRAAQAGSRRNQDDSPRFLRWYHYLETELVERLGGTPRCMTVPAYRVEQFCDGVLIQLTSEPFDAANQQHKEVQRQAMKHLGLLA